MKFLTHSYLITDCRASFWSSGRAEVRDHLTRFRCETGAVLQQLIVSDQEEVFLSCTFAKKYSVYIYIFVDFFYNLFGVGGS